jgi:hypothetical protein
MIVASVTMAACAINACAQTALHVAPHERPASRTTRSIAPAV